MEISWRHFQLLIATAILALAIGIGVKLTSADSIEIPDFCLTPKDGCNLLVNTAVLAALDASVIVLYKTTNNEVDVGPKDVQFWLFTKKNPKPEQKQILYSDAEGLEETFFDKNKQTKIFIHGWTQNGTTYENKIVPAYMNNHDVNFVMVDYGKHSGYGYIRSRTYVVEPVGEIIADFVNNLQSKGVPLNSIHVIGHSLGGQISGIVGHKVTGNVERITALDPAGPLFHSSPTDQRLDASDANFVDVIHTDGLGMGYPNNIGDADFFPNGGIAIQPGCPALDNKLINCSHQRSVDLFIESISPGAEFQAQKCEVALDKVLIKAVVSLFKHNETTETIQMMGEPASKTSRGTYCLKTAAKSPFALGKEGIKEESVLEKIF